MKHKLLISTILFLAAVGTASAQIKQGQTYIGGSVSVNYDGNGTTSYIPYLQGFTQYTVSKTTTMQISPEIGYFLSNKWSVSIQPTFSHSGGTETSYYQDYSNATTNSYVSVDKYNLNMIGLGFNVRYYWMFNEKVGLFPQFGVAALSNIKDLNYGTINLGGNANLVFFATPKLGINLGFGNLAYNVAYKTGVGTFNFGLNNSLVFGLNYYFGKN